MMRKTSLMQVGFGLATVLCGPAQANAQVTISDSVRLRNDCRLAAQIIDDGHPAEKWHWALTRLTDCPNGASALQVAWAKPPEDKHDIAVLEYSTRQLQDRRLIAALQSAASRQGASKLSRIAALSVLMSYLEDGLGLPLDEKLLSGNRWDFALQSRTGASPTQGEERITQEDRRQVVLWMKSLSESDPDVALRVLMKELATAMKDHLP